MYNFVNDLNIKIKRKYDTIIDMIEKFVFTNTRESISIAIKCIIQLQSYENTRKYIWIILESINISSRSEYMLKEYLIQLDINEQLSFGDCDKINNLYY